MRVYEVEIILRGTRSSVSGTFPTQDAAEAFVAAIRAAYAEAHHDVSIQRVTRLDVQPTQP